MRDDDDDAPTWRTTRGKYTWAICDRCRGEGQVDHPAFSNGISSEDFYGPDWDDESRQNYIDGAYDVPCPEMCEGGRVRVPIVANLSFAEKRQLVIERRAIQWRAEAAWEREREARMLGEW